MFSPFFISPGAPTSDANTLDNVDTKLTDVHEEEQKEPEGAVAPAEKEEKKRVMNKHSRGALAFGKPRRKHLSCSPERSIQGSVPADERAWCEKYKPEDGQAKVHATLGVHAEPGHAAHQVGEQRPRVN